MFGLSGLVMLDSITPLFECLRRIILRPLPSRMQPPQPSPQWLRNLRPFMTDIQFAIHFHTPRIDIR